MTQDDRTETITDPAEIRATDEPDERAYISREIRAALAVTTGEGE